MSKLPRAKNTDDYELQVIGRIADLLATLDRPARCRVLQYLTGRIETLPVIAMVDAAPEDGEESFLFPGHDREHDEVAA